MRLGKEKVPLVYSVCQSQSAVTNPLTQILINQQRENVFRNVKSHAREQPWADAQKRRRKQLKTKERNNKNNNNKAQVGR